MATEQGAERGAGVRRYRVTEVLADQTHGHVAIVMAESGEAALAAAELVRGYRVKHAVCEREPVGVDADAATAARRRAIAQALLVPREQPAEAPRADHGGVLFAVNPHKHGGECSACEGSGSVRNEAEQELERCAQCLGTGESGWCDSCAEGVRADQEPDESMQGTREIASVAPGGSVIKRIACNRDECLGTCTRWVLDSVLRARVVQQARELAERQAAEQERRNTCSVCGDVAFACEHSRGPAAMRRFMADHKHKLGEQG